MTNDQFRNDQFRNEYADHLIEQVITGRMTRRQLLVRASIFGFSATAIGSLLAACGSSGSSSSASKKPLLIGAPVPLTGPYAADGQTTSRALQVAVEDLNAKGGVNGRPLKLVTYDTQDLTADTVLAAAQNLCVGQKVAVNIACYAGCGPDVTSFGRYPQPFLNQDASAYDVKLIHQMGIKNFFQVCDVGEPYGAEAFKYLTEGIGRSYANKKIVCLAGDYPWDVDYEAGMAAAAKAAGWDVALAQTFPYGTNTWDSILAKIDRINPGIVSISDIDPADLLTFMDAFVPQASQSVVDVGYGMTVPGFTGLLATPGQGVFGMTCTTRQPDATGYAWMANYEKKFGQPAGIGQGPAMYDSAMLWAAAATAVGSAEDYAKVNSYIKNQAYKGICGTYKFNNDYVVPVEQNLLSYHVFQLWNGKLVELGVGSQPIKGVVFQTPPWLTK